uniref:Putative secreted protein n=1 Tax=Ixodes ricinus TaxID=34613 RepID=A0A147BUT9_IXORI
MLSTHNFLLLISSYCYLAVNKEAIKIGVKVAWNDICDQNSGTKSCYIYLLCSFTKSHGALPLCSFNCVGVHI